MTGSWRARPRIGSITKLFTAAVALQLTEGGLVALDAPVAELLPERLASFEHGEEITLRHLLGHTAGLSEPDIDRYVADALAHVTVADGVAALACEAVPRLDLVAYVPAEPAFEPGAGWAYSNEGYLLAGEVIEAVTGQPLARVYRELILDPLGLEDTWLDCDEAPRGELAGGIHPPGVYGLVLPGQGDEPFEVTDLDRAAGAAGGAGLCCPADVVAGRQRPFTMRRCSPTQWPSVVSALPSACSSSPMVAIVRRRSRAGRVLGVVPRRRRELFTGSVKGFYVTFRDHERSTKHGKARRIRLEPSGIG